MKRQPTGVGLGVISIVTAIMVLLSGCAPAAQSPTAAPAKQADSKPAETKPAAPAAPAAKPAESKPAEATKPAASSQEQIAKLVEGAKQEGQVVWLGSAMEEPSMVKEMEATFKKKYGLPESFKFNATRKSVREIPTLVETEIKANKVTYDIINMANLPWWLDMAKNNEIMAYDSPEYAAYSVPEKLGVNNRPYFVTDAYTFILAWNKKALPDLKLSSYNDLLKPELKGKMAFSTGHNSATALSAYVAMKGAMGPEFWGKLSAQEPAMLDSSAQRMDAVASGEYPVTPLAIPGDVWVQINAKKVDHLAYAWPTEGVTFLPMSTGILAKAPHPNAAMLFIDFFRTKEAQEIWMRGEGYISGRDGVVSPDTDLLKPITDWKVVPMDQRAFAGDVFKAHGDEWRAAFEKR